MEDEESAEGHREETRYLAPEVEYIPRPKLWFLPLNSRCAANNVLLAQVLSIHSERPRSQESAMNTRRKMSGDRQMDIIFARASIDLDNILLENITLDLSNWPYPSSQSIRMRNS